MSREVRMVPTDWQHPRYTEDDAPGPWAIGRYKALLGGNFDCLTKEWDEADRLWRGEGKSISYDGEVRLVKNLDCETFEEWDGPRPELDDYMPQWPDHERTHLMMYETTSEGTPISPAFATAEELARWLADNDASAFAGMTVSYEDWLATIHAGSTAGSAYTVDGGPIMPSAAGMAEKENPK